MTHQQRAEDVKGQSCGEWENEQVGRTTRAKAQRQRRGLQQSEGRG